jgi:perosamine synthetase
MIPLFKVFLPPREELMPALEEILYSGQISEGPPVKSFEDEFGRAFAAPNCISFYSGTAALHAALLIAGVQPGDEVISTPVTAEPTNMAICHAGARIVWADVDPRNGNLDPESVQARVTPRTRAIMAVHYGGIPVSLQRLTEVAAVAGVPVIEDAAHALGARYGGRPIGHDSAFTMFSLQAIKHMTTVDGGMLACRRPEDAQRGRLIRWFGIDREKSRTDVDVPIVGYKYHMNNVTATIGRVQLRHIGAVLDRHVANGRFFDQALSDVAGLTTCRWDAEAEPSYWFYTVLVDRPQDFIRRLQEQGIAASQVHKRNDRHSVFAASRAELPGVDAFYARMVHIPCGWWVGDEDRARMVDVIRGGW